MKREQTREWERQFRAPYLVWTSGNSCTEAAWWQCVRVEAGAVEKANIASFLWDMSNYYENVRRPALVVRARDNGFSM
eukprot:9073531-Alexandrium_andersonii.AAC.1